MLIEIKELEPKDFSRFKELNSLDKEWHNWNGPYFKKETQEEFQNRMAILLETLNNKETVEKEYIYINGEIVGKVNWYFKSKETNWVEVGIVIMDENYWNKGLGNKIMHLWMTKVFEMFPNIVRLGFTTWSGNIGMIKIGEKLGLNKEACYKNARIVNGKYYDSLSYGILRDDFFI